MDKNREFLFKLCLHLGYKSVSELEQTLSINELQEWYDFYIMNPFIEDRIELQLATLTEILVRSNSDTDASAIDFMISVSQEDKQKVKKSKKQQKLQEALESFGKE